MISCLRIELTNDEISGRPVYELLTSLQYIRGLNGGGITITVPEEFRTDFASIPRFFWRVFPPAGRYSKAAVVHDYLYSRSADCPRFLADAIFRSAMHELGVPFWQRWPIWAAVRLFGNRAYKSRRA
jgi:hypothetical protein